MQLVSKPLRDIKSGKDKAKLWLATNKDSIPRKAKLIGYKTIRNTK